MRWAVASSIHLSSSKTVSNGWLNAPHGNVTGLFHGINCLRVINVKVLLLMVLHTIRDVCTASQNQTERLLKTRVCHISKIKQKKNITKPSPQNYIMTPPTEFGLEANYSSCKGTCGV